MSDIEIAGQAAALTIAAEPLRREWFDAPEELLLLKPLMADCVGARLYQLLRDLPFETACEWKPVCSDILNELDLAAYLKRHAEFDFSVVFSLLMRDILTELAARLEDPTAGPAVDPELLDALMRLTYRGKEWHLLRLGEALDKGKSWDPLGWEQDMLICFAGFDAADIRAWLLAVSSEPVKVDHPCLRLPSVLQGLEPV